MVTPTPDFPTWIFPLIFVCGAGVFIAAGLRSYPGRTRWQFLAGSLVAWLAGAVISVLNSRHIGPVLACGGILLLAFALSSRGHLDTVLDYGTTGTGEGDARRSHNQLRALAIGSLMVAAFMIAFWRFFDISQ